MDFSVASVLQKDGCDRHTCCWGKTQKTLLLYLVGWILDNGISTLWVKTCNMMPGVYLFMELLLLYLRL